ncbi:SMP-30/gluconolactonase/LRE family protein (plasmid) [Paroceanicella profunda]|uniref:SMP-30/gluconolactonase/LRE family protein n=1 Tax=Paroceanicella profunda TaxID=2579971 RepID=A0A5B8G4Z7_9RHOB|nr:SMP-30/gluconolactonase/LRE family protein [Paroceanicella profunda]QDL94529.1 SMP-30/gluconolactonase/LRE family protein [Paroceanicella profunda]
MLEDIYDIRDPRFRALIQPNARLERLATGCRWTEGPVWFDDQQCLLFSDIPNERILRWSEGGASVFRAPSGFANGHTRDREGRLVSCQHGTRSLTRTEPCGRITTLAERFEGRRLNSPNDVVVHSDGGIWFTDPTYGILSNYEGYRAVPEQPARRVYRLDPDTGDIAAVAADFTQPNGLAFSPDEALLYVAESGASHDASVPPVIRVFDVQDGRALGPGRDFATIDAGIPDGLRVDEFGNLWSSAEDGVHCFAPDGTLIGKIRVPEVVANLCFGGARRNRLFITATTSLYAVYVEPSGIQLPRRG